MPRNITFRTHLAGSVNDFCEASGMQPLVRPNTLAELIVTLARYKEEGARLTPEIYLCTDVEQVLHLIPEHEIVYIGNTTLSEDFIGKVLKRCATLAIDGWCIFVEGKGENIRFGVFRDSGSPLSVPIAETLLSSGDGSIKLVRAYQIAEDCVEIRNHIGETYNVFLSHKKESELPPTEFAQNLVQIICERCPVGEREPVMTYLSRCLSRALAECHGTLIAVCPAHTVPKLLTDGVILEAPIDFLAKVRQAQKTRIMPYSLLSASALLTGMIGSDGIVVFTRDARLLAYGCFIKYSNKAGRAAGGGRRRAFDTLTARLGKGVSAVFIRSQDGWTDFRRVS